MSKQEPVKWGEATPSSVSIDELTLEPVRYAEEETLFGKRSIAMTVVLGDADTRRLRSVLEGARPLHVVRHGVSETPIPMRAGHTVHSRTADGDVKTRFTLAEKGADDGVSAMEVFAATLGNAIGLAAQERKRSDALLGLLVAKGVLTESESREVAERDEDAERDVRYSLSEVDDADDGWI